MSSSVNPSTASDDEIITQIVGWHANRFKAQDIVVERHDSPLWKADDVLFDTVDTSLQEISFHVTKYIITGIEATLNSDHEQSFGKVSAGRDPCVKVRSFRFQIGERLTSLTLYFNYSGVIRQVESTRAGVQESQSGIHRLTDILSLQSRRQIQSEDSEYGYIDRSYACCCGIEFSTNRRRHFRAMSWDPIGFKNSYRVYVDSGQCCGLIANGREGVSYLGFLFKKDSELMLTASSSLASPLIGFKSGAPFWKNQPKKPRFQTLLQNIGRQFARIVPPAWLVTFEAIRKLILQFILPAYDIVSDIIAAYYYYKEGVHLVALLIVIFVLLPHFVFSVALIGETVLGHGEFDEYPRLLVSFYQSKLTPWFFLSIIIKFLTTPFLTILVVVFFLQNLLVNAYTKIKELFRVTSFKGTVGERHPPDIRMENIRQDAWSKDVFKELIFESFPQLITQISALVFLYNSEDSVRSYPIFASIAVSGIMFIRQGWIFSGFMHHTEISFYNSLRIMFSGALDFFPIFNLHTNGVKSVLIRFYPGPLFLELWNPLCRLMVNNVSLQLLTLYLEDAVDWFDMSMELLDSLARNENIQLKILDICLEKKEGLVVSRIDEFKERLYYLLREEKVQKIYLLIHEDIDMGIVGERVTETTQVFAVVQGIKWTWDWPSYPTTRLEYCLEKVL